MSVLPEFTRAAGGLWQAVLTFDETELIELAYLYGPSDGAYTELTELASVLHSRNNPYEGEQQ